MTLKENTFEYKMTEQLAKTLLKSRRGNDKKVENQKYLCKWVNTNLGLKGRCVSVLTTL